MDPHWDKKNWIWIRIIIKTNADPQPWNLTALWLWQKIRYRTSVKTSVVDPDPDLAARDSDPYWECLFGSVLGMLIRIQEHRNWKMKLVSYVFYFELLHTSSIFSCKSSTFCDFKVWPVSGSAWIRIGLAPCIRIQICSKRKARSRSALKPTRIHNPGKNTLTW